MMGVSDEVFIELASLQDNFLFVHVCFGTATKTRHAYKSNSQGLTLTNPNLTPEQCKHQHNAVQECQSAAFNVAKMNRGQKFCH